MPTVAVMEEEELVTLEQGGGLKERTLVRRTKSFNHFAAFWEVEGREELSELFKSPEGRAKFSKIFGRWIFGMMYQVFHYNIPGTSSNIA